VLGILGFCLLWNKNTEINERHIGLLSTTCIFLLPYAHYHDLILLLIPIFCILRIYQKQDAVHQNYLAVTPLVASWLFALGFTGSGVFKFPIVYAAMFFLIYLFNKSIKLPPSVFSPLSQ